MCFGRYKKSSYLIVTSFFNLFFLSINVYGSYPDPFSIQSSKEEIEQSNEEIIHQITNNVIMSLGNRIETLKQQITNNQQPIDIEPLNQQYFTQIKIYTRNTPAIHKLVIQLFNVIDTIDNNINIYLNNPDNTAIKDVLNGALKKCISLRNQFLDISKQTKYGEYLNIVANYFINVAQKIHAVTDTMLKTVVVAEPKKSKNPFKRLFGK
jgi:hypothetical protein